MASKRLKIAIAEIIEDELTSDLLFDFNVYQQLWQYPVIPHLSLLSTIREEHLRPPLYSEQWLIRYLDQDFFSHFRMYRAAFEKLLSDVGHFYKRSDIRHHGGRLPISLEKGLLMTLWYLAKGDTILSIADRFNVSLSAVHTMLSCILHCINALDSKYIRWPTVNECRRISEEFQEKGGYPDVIGAIDGSHIPIKVPEGQQDSYINRKFFHSIILQGICTAKKLFTNIFVGFPGSAHDARVLRESQIYKETVQLDTNKYFYNKYHLVGDSAYPCLSWLMKPYRDTGRLTPHQRRHNKILSTTRVVIENCFALCKERWRILKYINVYSVERAVEIAYACCILHNFCLLEFDAEGDVDIDLQTEDDQLTGAEYAEAEQDRNALNKRDVICQNL